MAILSIPCYNGMALINQSSRRDIHEITTGGDRDICLIVHKGLLDNRTWTVLDGEAWATIIHQEALVASYPNTEAPAGNRVWDLTPSLTFLSRPRGSPGLFLLFCDGPPSTQRAKPILQIPLPLRVKCKRSPLFSLPTSQVSYTHKTSPKLTLPYGFIQASFLIWIKCLEMEKVSWLLLHKWTLWWWLIRNTDAGELGLLSSIAKRTLMAYHKTLLDTLRVPVLVKHSNQSLEVGQKLYKDPHATQPNDPNKLSVCSQHRRTNLTVSTNLKL